jgi:hypothetical protein
MPRTFPACCDIISAFLMYWWTPAELWLAAQCTCLNWMSDKGSHEVWVLAVTWLTRLMLFIYILCRRLILYVRGAEDTIAPRGVHTIADS